MPVRRGPSLRDCSDEIVSAVVADIEAREQRDIAALERHEERFWEMVRQGPSRIAWGLLNRGNAGAPPDPGAAGTSPHPGSLRS